MVFLCIKTKCYGYFFPLASNFILIAVGFGFRPQIQIDISLISHTLNSNWLSAWFQTLNSRKSWTWASDLETHAALFSTQIFIFCFPWREVALVWLNGIWLSFNVSQPNETLVNVPIQNYTTIGKVSFKRIFADRMGYATPGRNLTKILTIIHTITKNFWKLTHNIQYKISRGHNMVQRVIIYYVSTLSSLIYRRYEIKHVTAKYSTLSSKTLQTITSSISVSFISFSLPSLLLLLSQSLSVCCFPFQQVSHHSFRLYIFTSCPSCHLSITLMPL